MTLAKTIFHFSDDRFQQLIQFRSAPVAALILSKPLVQFLGHFLFHQKQAIEVDCEPSGCQFRIAVFSVLMFNRNIWS